MQTSAFVAYDAKVMQDQYCMYCKSFCYIYTVIYCTTLCDSLMFLAIVLIHLMLNNLTLLAMDEIVKLPVLVIMCLLWSRKSVCNYNRKGCPLESLKTLQRPHSSV